MRRAPVFATAGIILSMMLGAPAAFGCRCIFDDNPDVAAAVDASDFVFFGQVMRGVGMGEGFPESSRGWEFDIASVWKGPHVSSQVLYAHSINGEVSSCDSSFEVGATYVVFAVREGSSNPARYRPAVCLLTSKVDLEDIRVLRIIGELGESIYEPPKPEERG